MNTPPCLTAPPCHRAAPLPQMTHSNVGSLLVFDPSKMHLVATKDNAITSASKDAVVGIITERGEEPEPKSAAAAAAAIADA